MVMSGAGAGFSPYEGDANPLGSLPLVEEEEKPSFWERLFPHGFGISRDPDLSGGEPTGTGTARDLAEESVMESRFRLGSIPDPYSAYREAERYSQARELGTDSSAFTQLRHDIFLHEQRSQNIAIGSGFAAPLSFAAAPAVIAAAGGGVAGWAGGLLGTGFLASAPSLPTTLGGAFSRLSPGGASLTAGEGFEVGLDITADLLLGGVGAAARPVVRPLIRGLSSFMRRTPTPATPIGPIMPAMPRQVIRGEDAFDPTFRIGTDTGTTYSLSQLARRNLGTSSQLIPDISDVELDRQANQLVRELEVLRGGSIVATERNVAFNKAKSIIRAELPSASDLRDVREEAAASLARHRTLMEEQSQRLREAGRVDVAEELDRGTSFIFEGDNYEKSLREQRSNIYEHQDEIYAQELESRVRTTQVDFAASMDEMFKDIIIPEKMEAFRTGFMDPRTGVSSITTAKGQLTSGGEVASFEKSLYGSPQAVIFDKRFDPDGNFYGTVKFSGKLSERAHLKNWLDDAGLYVMQSDKTGPTQELRLSITNNPDIAQKSFGVWRQLDVQMEELVANISEFTGKRGGIVAATADIAHVSPEGASSLRIYSDMATRETHGHLQLAFEAMGPRGVVQTNPLDIALIAKKPVVEVFEKGTGNRVVVPAATLDDPLFGSKYYKRVIPGKPEGVAQVVERTDAQGVISRRKYVQILRQEFRVARPDATRADENTFLREMVETGDVAFALQAGVDTSLFKTHLEVMRTSDFNQLVHNLVEDGTLKAQPGQVIDAISSMESLKMEGGLSNIRGIIRARIDRPANRPGQTVVIGESEQISPAMGMILGHEGNTLADVTRSMVSGLSNEMRDSLNSLNVGVYRTAGEISYLMEQRAKGILSDSAHLDEDDLVLALNEALSVIEDDTGAFVQKAITKGIASSSVLRFMASPLQKAVQRGGIGNAPPSSMFQGVTGRFLSPTYFGSPVDDEHVKLVFDDIAGKRVYRGFTLHENDIPRHEVILATESFDGDDKAIDSLLYRKGLNGPEYYVTILRSPTGPAGGLLRRVTVEDATAFRNETGVKQIDVTYNMVRGEDGKPVLWNFEDVQYGLRSHHESPAMPAGELPVADQLSYRDTPQGMLDHILNTSVKVGSLPMMDVYMRLLRDSGSNSPYIRAMVSDSLDAGTRMTGSFSPGIDVIREELKKHLDGGGTLSRETVEQYDYLKRDFETWLGTQASVQLPTYEYKSGAQALARGESLLQIDVYDKLLGLTSLGNPNLLVKKYSSQLMGIATKAVSRSGEVHSKFSGLDYQGRVSGKALRDEQSRVYDEALSQAKSAGFITDDNLEDFAGAIMQASVLEVSASPRRGFGGGVSGEAVSLLPRNVWSAYFDEFPGDIPASLRVEVAGSIGSKLQANREYVVQLYGGQYHIGTKRADGTFTPIQRVSDSELGAIASHQGVMRYRGVVGATQDNVSVGESAIFTLEHEDIGKHLDEVAASLAKVDSDTPGLDLSNMGRGVFLPQGSLVVEASASISKQGLWSRTRGGAADYLSPEEVNALAGTERKFLTFDIEAKYDNRFRGAMRKLGIRNRDRDSIGYIRGKTSDKVHFIDAEGKSQYTDQFALGIDEYTPQQMSATMQQIQSQVTDVIGYNVSFDMDITTRLLGTNWGDKTTWDVMRAADVAGLGNRARMRRYAELETSAAADMPAGLPLKDKLWSAVRQLGVNMRPKEGVNALELMERYFKNPFDRELLRDLREYASADVEETAELFDILRTMLPEQFGDAPVSGETWSDLALEPVAARYRHFTDPNDVRIGSEGIVDSIDPSSNDYREHVRAVHEMIKRGESFDRMPLLMAWLNRATGSGIVGPLAAAPRGIQAAGQGFAWGTGKVGQGIGWAARKGTDVLTPAVGGRIRSAVSDASESKLGMFMRGLGKTGPASIVSTQGSEEGRELSKGSITEVLFGSTQLGQLARVMQFPGIYRHSGLKLTNFLTISAVTGMPFMSGWRSSQRALGRFVAPYSHASQFASEKLAQVTRSEMNDKLNRGRSYEDIARQLLDNDVIDKQTLATMRDSGDLNEIMRNLYKEQTDTSGFYDEFREAVDVSRRTSPLFRRVTSEGYVQYGNRATQPIKALFSRGFTTKRSTLPEHRERYLKREAASLRATGSESYMERAASFLPYEDVPEDVLAANRQHFLDRGADMDHARFDPDYDLSLMTQAQKDSLDSTYERRVRYARDLRKSWTFGRFDPPEGKTSAMGKIGRIAGVGGTRESFQYRLGGGPLDPKEWSWDKLRPSEFLPTRSSAKFLIAATGGAGFGLGPLAYQAGMGAYWQHKGKKDFEDFDGYDTEDLWNAEFRRSSDKTQWSSYPKFIPSGEIFNIPIHRSISNLPIRIYPGEYAAGPRAEYARRYNEMMTEQGGDFDRMNEEYSHRKMQIGMQPSQLHPFQLMKLALTPGGRRGDFLKTIRMPFTEQDKSFSDIFREDWGPLSGEGRPLVRFSEELQGLSKSDWANLRARRFNSVYMSPELRSAVRELDFEGMFPSKIGDVASHLEYSDSGEMTDSDWDSVARGQLDNVSSASLRSELMNIRTSLSESEYEHQVGEMRAYYHYYKTGGKKGGIASALGDKFRQTAAQDLGATIRSDALDRLDPDDRGNLSRAWQSLHMAGRSAFGEGYTYEGDEWSRGWAEGAIRPREAMRHEYDVSDYYPGRVYERDEFTRTPELSIFDRVRDAFGGVTYVEPKEGSEYIYIPKLSEPKEEKELPKMQEGGIFKFHPGGIDVTVAESGDEAIIPLDRLSDLIGFSGGADNASTAELIKIAESIHDLARIVGTLDVSLGDMDYNIEASNKGMAEALSFVQKYRERVASGGEFTEGETLEWAPIGSARDISSIPRFDGDPMELDYFREKRETREAEVSEIFDWTPFEEAGESSPVWDWAESFESSGVYNLKDEILNAIDLDSIGKDIYQNFFSPDEMRASENVRMGLDRSGDPLPTKMRLAQGTPAVDNLLKGLKPGQIPQPFEVAPELYESGTIKPSLEDMVLVDGDTFRMLTEDSQFTSSDIRDLSPVSIESIENQTESIRLQGGDTPEYDEALGIYGNVALAAFTQQAGDMLRLDTLGQAAGGESVFGTGKFDPEARNLARLYSITPTGGERDYSDFLFATGMTREKPKNLQQEALLTYARDLEVGLVSERAIESRVGYDVDMRALSATERAERVSGYTVAEGDMHLALQGLTEMEMRGFADINRPRQMSTLPDVGARADEIDMYEVVEAVTQASISVTGDKPTGGAFNISQVIEKLGAGDRVLSGDVALLGALYSEDPSTQHIRDAAIRNESARSDSLETIYKWESAMESRGLGDQNLVATMPDDMKDALGVKGDEGRVFAGTTSLWQEVIGKEKERAFREIDTLLKSEYSGLVDTVGASTAQDTQLLGAALTRAYERVREETEDVLEFETVAAPTGEALTAKTTEYVLQEYSRSQDEVRSEKYLEAARVRKAKTAAKDIKLAASYFDPFASAATSEQIDTAYERFDDRPTARAVMGFAGRMTGIGTAEDMFAASMQLGAAGDELRKDPAMWGMIGTQGRDVYSGGFERSMVDLAVNQYEGTLARRLSTSELDADASQLVVQSLQAEFGSIITPYAGALEGELGTEDINTELEIVSALFQAMFDDVVAGGTAAASEIKSLDFTPEERVKLAVSYFDPFASDLKADHVTEGYKRFDDRPTARAVMGFAGRMSGIGTAEDMFATSMQFAVAGKELRKDPVMWGMIGSEGREVYRGGFQRSLTDLAVSQYESNLGRDLSTSALDLEGSQGIIQGLQAEFGSMITPFVGEIQGDLGTDAINSELDIVSALFQAMFDSVIASGSAAASEIKGLDFTPEFGNANLRRNVAGGVEFRRTLDNLPSGFVEALKEMGPGASIIAPGDRSAEQTAGAFEVSPGSGLASPDSGVWQTGGATYTYSSGGGEEGTVKVIENISKKVEQKEFGDKWYTYVDGVWDQEEPTQDKKNLPSEVLLGTMETVYDVATKQMIRQYETYEDTGRVKLFEGAPINLPKEESLKLGEGLELSAEDLKKLVDHLKTLFPEITSQQMDEFLDSLTGLSFSVDDITSLMTHIHNLFPDITSEQMGLMLESFKGSNFSAEDIAILMGHIKDLFPEITDEQMGKFLESFEGSSFSVDDVTALMSYITGLFKDITPEQVGVLLASFEGSNFTQEDITILMGHIKNLFPEITPEQMGVLLDSFEESTFTAEDVTALMDHITTLFKDITPEQMGVLLSSFEESTFSAEDVTVLMNHIKTLFKDITPEQMSVLLDSFEESSFSAEDVTVLMDHITTLFKDITPEQMGVLLSSFEDSSFTVEDLTTLMDHITTLFEGITPEQMSVLLSSFEDSSFTAEDVTALMDHVKRLFPDVTVEQMSKFLESFEGSSFTSDDITSLMTHFKGLMPDVSLAALAHLVASFEGQGFSASDATSLLDHIKTLFPKLSPMQLGSFIKSMFDRMTDVLAEGGPGLWRAMFGDAAISIGTIIYDYSTSGGGGDVGPPEAPEVKEEEPVVEEPVVEEPKPKPPTPTGPTGAPLGAGGVPTQMHAGGFALPTSGGFDINIAEMGEGEAILPISKVPGIFAEAFAKSAESMKSMFSTSLDITNPMEAMLATVPAMNLAMQGATDGYMDSVNAGGDGIIVIENRITLEMGGEEVANMILESEEYARRSGR